MKTLSFNGYDCYIKQSHYNVGGRTSLSLVCAKTGDYFHKGDPIAHITVNIPDEDIPGGTIVVKDYAENAGMLDLLLQAGIVGKPVSRLKTGFVTVPVCPFNQNICDQYKP